jgi:hypothetical protein
MKPSPFTQNDWICSSCSKVVYGNKNECICGEIKKNSLQLYLLLFYQFIHFIVSCVQNRFSQMSVMKLFFPINE